MKKLAIYAAAALIAVAGYWGYQKNAQRAFAEQITPHIKNATIRVSNAGEIELKPSQITFREIFSKFEGDISEIDKHLIEVQAASTAQNTKITTPAVSYLRAAQDFSRAMLSKNRKLMAANTAMDSWKDSISELKNASSYGYTYAIQRVDKNRENLDKALLDAKEADADFVKAIDGLKTARASAVDVFPDDALVSDNLLRDLAASTKPAASTAASASASASAK